MAVSLVSSSIPVHLEELFDMMDFIGSAIKGNKICFKNKTFVESKSWFGSLFRRYNGENQATRGNEIVRKCCKESSEAYRQYKSHPLGKIILDKILKLRHGIQIIISNYIDDISVVNHLNGSILFLDLEIPGNIKESINMGKILEPSSSSVEESP